MRKMVLLAAMLALLLTLAVPVTAQEGALDEGYPFFGEDSGYAGEDYPFDDVSGSEEDSGSDASPGEPQCDWYFNSADRDEWWEYWCWWPGWGWEFVFWVWA